MLKKTELTLGDKLEIETHGEWGEHGYVAALPLDVDQEPRFYTFDLARHGTYHLQPGERVIGVSAQLMSETGLYCPLLTKSGLRTTLLDKTDAGAVIELRNVNRYYSLILKYGMHVGEYYES